jgi:hypothetical protein
MLYKNGQLQDARLADFDQRAIALAEAAHVVTRSAT